MKTIAMSEYKVVLPSFGVRGKHYTFSRTFKYSDEEITLEVRIAHEWGSLTNDVRVACFRNDGDESEVLTEAEWNDCCKEAQEHDDVFRMDKLLTFEMLRLWGYCGCEAFVEDALRRWEAIKMLVQPEVRMAN